MIDYLQRGKTVTGIYYAELIRKLRAAIKNKRCGKLHQSVLLRHDMAAIRECGFELLNHPPYSTDLAPADFHVFRS